MHPLTAVQKIFFELRQATRGLHFFNVFINVDRNE